MDDDLVLEVEQAVELSLGAPPMTMELPEDFEEGATEAAVSGKRAAAMAALNDLLMERALR